MTTRIIKITKAVFPPDGPWRIEDKTGEINEEIWPDAALKEWMGGRSWATFYAEKHTAEGWRIKRRYRGTLYW